MVNKLVSPDELHRAAKNKMLGGKDPTSTDDWAKVVNFWAINVTKEGSESVVLIMAKLYNCPLEEGYLRRVVKFQNQKKK